MDFRFFNHLPPLNETQHGRSPAPTMDADSHENFLWIMLGLVGSCVLAVTILACIKCCRRRREEQENQHPLLEEVQVHRPG